MARTWARSRESVEDPGAVPARPSLGLAVQVLLDELLISTMKNPRLLPHRADYERAGIEVAQAFELYRERGWLDNPETYHRPPPPPEVWSTRGERVLGQPYEHLSFQSAYEPHRGEPGRERWLEKDANRTAHAWVLRQPHAGRPWVVCVHGFGTGAPFVDLRAFRARRLHGELGLNVVVPVLPLHGPRQESGVASGDGFMSIDLVDTVHALAQSAWDVRSLIGWARVVGGDAPVGIWGLSLGGYVASLVAALEDGLACAIAGIPATDILDLYHRHSPSAVRQRALEHGALGAEATAVQSVVSPLVLQPKLPRDRRYVFAGLGDRMSTSGQALRLWEHWERPSMAWYPGGHVGFWWVGSINRFVTDALIASGLAVTPGGGHRPPTEVTAK
jgi:dienelactone hydrolase